MKLETSFLKGNFDQIMRPNRLTPFLHGLSREHDERPRASRPAAFAHSARHSNSNPLLRHQTPRRRCPSFRSLVFEKINCIDILTSSTAERLSHSLDK